MTTMVDRERAMDDPEMQVFVRLATADDVPDLLGLYQQLAGGRLTALPADPVEAKSLVETMAAQSGRQLLVAEVNCTVVGTADLLIVPNLTHGGAPWAIVENVVVDDGTRRRGVGRALMAEMVRRCKDAGCYKMQLLSNKQRSHAHDFYRSVGFEAIAEGFRQYLE
jgi:GNAT superfamily N-acetyltransferase